MPRSFSAGALRSKPYLDRCHRLQGGSIDGNWRKASLDSGHARCKARQGAEPTIRVGVLPSAYLERDGRSLNSVAQAALVDVGYLWHLRAGTKRRPSRDVLIRVGLALSLEPGRTR